MTSCTDELQPWTVFQRQHQPSPKIYEMLTNACVLTYKSYFARDQDLNSLYANSMAVSHEGMWALGIG